MKRLQMGLSFLTGLVLSVCFGLNLLAPVEGQQLKLVPVESKEPPVAEKKDAPKKVYATGHKSRVDFKIVKAYKVSFHGEHLKRLPKATAADYDCRTLGLVPPIVDQGQCGSCWDFSGTGVVTSSLIKAGYGKADGSFMGSEQYTLDCYQNGGCNGDDNTTVLDHAKSVGIPLTSQYGPYRGSPQRCGYVSSMTLYKIADWGFCTTSNEDGVANVQDIKNAMVQYGPIGCAIAADDAFMNSPAGQVFTGSGSRQINHDVILVGWHDDASIPGGGYWILRNSWGTSWCENGYIRIAYGANQVGTEAVWATATPVTPPTPALTGTLNVTVALPAGSYSITTANGAATLVTTAVTPVGQYALTITPSAPPAPTTVTLTAADASALKQAANDLGTGMVLPIADLQAIQKIITDVAQRSAADCGCGKK